MKIVIIGGVAGGATAATRLRRLSEDNEIIVFERGQHVSFANCGLPYHVGGIIKDREELLLQTPESLKERFHLDVRIQTEVLSINKEQKTVTVRNLLTGESYEESYDKLLLAPGAEPLRPPIEGINDSLVLTLRNVADMDRIISHAKDAQKIAVVGGGFIGLEMAENLIEAGKDVTLVEMAPQIMSPIDFEMAAILQQHSENKGLKLLLGTAVQQFTRQSSSLQLSLSNGDKLDADLVILAIGVKPENKLAKEAGLEIGVTGGIEVNKFLQTSDQHIYAVGDAVEVAHYINQQAVLIPLAWPANRQARVVADNMVKGNVSAYNGSLGTSILKLFDLTAAAVGLNERMLKKNEIAYQTAIVTRGSHAGYYPDATPIVLKVLFDPDGKILGAQAVGEKGVDKRIDVIATAIKGQLRVQDLPDLELAYAPPFNSAKDPVNIVGYVAENLLDNSLQMIDYSEVSAYLQNEEVVFLDVRTAEELNATGSIPNAQNIDLNELRQQLDSLDKSKEYIVYCQVGLRGYLAYRIMTQHGFRVKNLNGGYHIWKTATQAQ